MLRAAAKNFRSVTVVPSPEFYEEVLAALEGEGQVPEETRRRLALAAFRRTADYDAAISAWLGERVEGETELRRRPKVSPSIERSATSGSRGCVTGRTRTRMRPTTRRWVRSIC